MSELWFAVERSRKSGFFEQLLINLAFWIAPLKTCYPTSSFTELALFCFKAVKALIGCMPNLFEAFSSHSLLDLPAEPVKVIAQSYSYKLSAIHYLAFSSRGFIICYFSVTLLNSYSYLLRLIHCSKNQINRPINPIRWQPA